MNKIHWNGNKQQLIELYNHLIKENQIPNIKLNAFLSHFTDEKGKPYSKTDFGKIEWIGNKYTLGILINYLIKFSFVPFDLNPIKYKVLEQHFNGVSKSLDRLYEKNLTSFPSKVFIYKLWWILPADAVKGKKYYKLRNKDYPNGFEYSIKCNGLDLLGIDTETWVRNNEQNITEILTNPFK